MRYLAVEDDTVEAGNFIEFNAELLGRLRVADRREHEPDCAVVVVDAVPEATSAGSFVLPLLQPDATDVALRKIAAKRMLTVASASRI